MTDYLAVRTVGQSLIYQDTDESFEFTLEDLSGAHDPQFRVVETWRPSSTPSCFHRRTLYAGDSMSRAMDEQRDSFALVVRAKLDGGRLVMRPRAAAPRGGRADGSPRCLPAGEVIGGAR